ncbi:MAG: hypothetical protein KAI40_10375 [Desulfobacterales bacterium]|nr:hypothetical protein [Desulfobacterales bacterium]
MDTPLEEIARISEELASLVAQSTDEGYIPIVLGGGIIVPQLEVLPVLPNNVKNLDYCGLIAILMPTLLKLARPAMCME